MSKHSDKLNAMRDSIARAEAALHVVEAGISSCERQHRDQETALAHDTRALEIVNNVLLATEMNVKEFVENTVSMALSIVYGQEYAFQLTYEIKRGQSECTPWIVKNGVKHSPREEVGVGICDVVAFALRLVVWSLQTPRGAPVFILDEPGRHISPDKQGNFGAMLSKLSQMLGVQIIMVTHARQLVDVADKAYLVIQEKGVSRVQDAKV